MNIRHGAVLSGDSRSVSHATLLLVNLAVVVSFCGSLPGQQSGSFERPDIEQLRRQWFDQRRAAPDGFIPAYLRVNALQQMQQMEQEERQVAAGNVQAYGPVLSTSTWTQIGPFATNSYWGHASGRVFALAVDPRNSNVVYAGTHGGGVWKTFDGGLTWSPLTDTQPSLGAAAIAIYPNNPDTLYVGTGVDYGAGVLKSTDGGLSWVNYPGPFVGPFGSDNYFGGNARISSIAVSPADPNVVLVGLFLWPESNAGVYRSADGGQSWSKVLFNTPGHTVAFDPTNGNIAYAALCGGYPPPGQGFNQGIYKSLNGGQTWGLLTGSGVNTLPISSQISDCQVVVQPSNPSILWAVIVNQNYPNNTHSLYKSTDAGQNWTKVNGALPVSDILFVAPTNPSVVFVGGFDLYRSLDGGQSFTDISNGSSGLHVDQHSYAFDANASRLYEGNDGGIWTTTDIGVNPVRWTNLNNGLATQMFYPGMAIHPTNPDIAFFGSQDNGTEKYSGLPTWDEVTCGDGGWNAIDTTITNNIYAECYLISIQKSTNGGTFFTSAINGINTSDRAAFIAPLVMDPSNSQRLYFGTFRIYQTTNGAGLWTPISPDLTGGGGTVNAIYVSPSDPNSVYAAVNNSIWVTSNALTGANWNNRSNGLPNRTLTQVVVDPVNPQIAYVTVSGFSGFFGDTLGHVFRTGNGGVNWTDISGNLPNVPANDIVVDPDRPNTLYVGTDIGVFGTATGGSPWITLMSGFPYVIVNSLKFFHPTRTLRAATYGRSVWDLSLNAAPDYTLNIANPVLTVFKGQTGTFNGILASKSFYGLGVTLTCGSGHPAICNPPLSPLVPVPQGSAFSVNASDSTPGDYRFNITGTGSDLLTRSQQVLLQVVDFNVTAPAPSAVTVAQGNPSSAIVFDVTAAGSFNGAVTLSCAGLPSGTTCSFLPSAVVYPRANAPVHITLTINTGAAAAGGPTPVQIVASSAGAPGNKVAGFSLTIVAGTGFANLNVSINHTSPSPAPVGSAVAYKVIVQNLTPMSSVNADLLIQPSAGVLVGPLPAGCAPLLSGGLDCTFTSTNGSANSFSVTALAPLVRNLSMTASASSAASDSDPTDNVRTDIVPVRLRPFTRPGLGLLVP